MTARVLVIEDEVDLATTLEYNLRSEGLHVQLAYTGKQGLSAAATDPLPDVIVLDLMLPDLSGTEICRRLREQEPRDVPIIMCTAKGEEIDRVVGFEVGADDYVVKPYSVRELVLRIRAQLRHRTQRTTAEPARLRFGVLDIDPDAHRAWIEGVEVSLTALEFRLLHTFVSRRGRVQTREALLRDVWGIDADVTTRTVDTHVKRLREKLGAAGAYIETLRGVGYRFAGEGDQEDV